MPAYTFNERDYKDLCANCDKILLLHSSELVVTAIPWLHVLREHPVLLKEYATVFEQSKKNLTFFFQTVNTILKGLSHIGASLFGSRNSFSSEIELSKVDYLFVSHLLNESQAGKEEDFYFGTAPNQLIKQGKSVIIVLLNHSNVSNENLTSKWKNDSIVRLVLGRRISLYRAATIYSQMVFSAFKIIGTQDDTKNKLFRLIKVRAAVEALSSGTFANRRLEQQVRTIVATFSSKNIVVTYEGHAYERMLFHAARKGNPNIHCIGYQHSALFKLQHSLKRKLSHIYNPDIILASSLISKMDLLKQDGLKGIQVEVLGSNKYSQADIIAHPQAENFSFLVMPEGFTSECNVLFQFSLELARRIPSCQFIWRLHPVISFNDLKASNPLFDQLPDNIILSAQTLEEDIAASKATIYRGTTAVVKAVAAGLIPIYLQLSTNELTIDPLYAIHKGKIIVQNAAELVEIFDQSNELKAYQQQGEEIRKFCTNFFDPIDISVFEKIHQQRILN